MPEEKKSTMSPEIYNLQMQLNMYAIQMKEIDDIAAQKMYQKKILMIVLDDTNAYYRFLVNFIRKNGGSGFSDTDFYDMITDAVYKASETYSPEKCDKFSAYLIQLLKFEKMEYNRKETKLKERTCEMPKQHQTNDNEDSEETEIEFPDTSESPWETIQQQELIIHFITVYAKYRQHNKPKKKDYRQLFFTGKVVDILQNVPVDILKINTNILYTVLNYDLIDFAFTKPCRTVEEIQKAEPKIYAQISDDVPASKKNMQLEIPFKAIVYIAFLKTCGFSVSNAAISQQRKEFDTFLHDQLRI